MKHLISPNLLEEILLLEVRRREDAEGAQSVRDFYAGREPIYRLPSERKREEAFALFHQEMFEKWELGRPITERLAEFPQLEPHVRSVHLNLAGSRKEEGSDLYNRVSDPAEGFSLLFKVLPETYLSGEPFCFFMRQELQHAVDMLDPEFGYVPELPENGLTKAAANLLRDRYRVVWATSVDGRLSRRGLVPASLRNARWSEFERAFSRVTAAELEESFKRFWEDDHPTHAAMLRFCREFGRASTGPVPGAPCPLCGFPTYDWGKDLDRFPPRLTEQIQADFPSWQISDSLCGQCLEIYRSRSNATQRVPANLMV